MAVVSRREGETQACLRVWIWQLVALSAVGGLFLVEASPWLAGIRPGLDQVVRSLVMVHGVLQALAAWSIGMGWPRRRAALAALLLAVAAEAVMNLLLPTPLRWRFSLLLYAVISGVALPGLAPRARGSLGCRVLLLVLSAGCVSNFGSFLLDVPIMSPHVVLSGYLVALVGSVGLLLWHEERLQQRLADIAMTDALTGALNRHGLVPRLKRELDRARHVGKPLSVVLCDLDHFKRVNDTLGHGAGDAVLRHFVQRAAQAIRPGDLMGRWGGEEFLFVLPDTALLDAVMVAERVRRLQAEPATGLPHVTVSLGVATAGPGEGAYQLSELVATADRRLYIAKATRDRVVHRCEPAAPLAPARAEPLTV